jgi:hypothetical protein
LVFWPESAAIDGTWSRSTVPAAPGEITAHGPWLAAPAGDSRARLAAPAGDSRARLAAPAGDSRARLAAPAGDSRAWLAAPAGDSRARGGTEPGQR